MGLDSCILGLSLVQGAFGQFPHAHFRAKLPLAALAMKSGHRLLFMYVGRRLMMSFLLREQTASAIQFEEQYLLGTSSMRR